MYDVSKLSLYLLCVVLLVAMRAQPAFLGHLLTDSLKLPPVTNQQACPAESSIGRATSGALRLACPQEKRHDMWCLPFLDYLKIVSCISVMAEDDLNLIYILLSNPMKAKQA